MGRGQGGGGRGGGGGGGGFTAEQREILDGDIRRGLPPSEIATRLRVPSDTVRNYLRARGFTFEAGVSLSGDFSGRVTYSRNGEVVTRRR